MTNEEKIGTAERDPEGKAGECCEPVCGPTTCEPGAEAAQAKVVEAKVEEKPKEASCGCGPTCS